MAGAAWIMIPPPTRQAPAILGKLVRTGRSATLRLPNRLNAPITHTTLRNMENGEAGSAIGSVFAVAALGEISAGSGPGVSPRRSQDLRTSSTSHEAKLAIGGCPQFLSGARRT
ncbi:hypothetical protein GCM10023158_29520 [Gluconacetobacter tumulicola]